MIDMSIRNTLSSINKEVFNEVLTSEAIPLNFLKTLLKLVDERKNGKYLDIACNDGTSTEKISLIAKVSEIYGIDIAEKALDIARNRGIRTIFHDLNEEKRLPFPGNYFDIITCLEVVEHVLSSDFVLDEIYRLLKPTGYAILSTPRFDSLYVIGLLLFGFQPGVMSVSTDKNYGGFWKNAKFHHSGHVHLFTKKAFKEILVSHSFNIVKYTEVNFFIPVPFRKDTQIWKVTPIKL